MRVQRPFILGCVKQDAPFLNAGKLTWSIDTCQAIVLFHERPHLLAAATIQPVDTGPEPLRQITFAVHDPNQGYL